MSSREGFNLFHKFGRKHFFRRGLFGDRWARDYVLRDTFGRYICAILGHTKKTFETDDEPPRIICLRCFREVNCSEGGVRWNGLNYP